MGRCAGCDAWNTLVEEERIKAAAPAARGRPSVGERKPGRAIPITEVQPEDTIRQQIGIGELDRVLGGGLVPGSLVLLGGEPGVGKSTLLLCAALGLAQQGIPTLYVSAEESVSQTRLRAERLDAIHPELFLLAETDLGVVEREVDRIRPLALVLDSVQTLYVPDLDSAPGTVSQIREVTARVMHLSKGLGLSTFLVGHVTKEGTIAGPRLLEHMVDTVLYFENTRAGPYRILRAHKNRFGSTNELGVFEMQGQGLVDVPNPSAFFLAERPQGAPGSVVAAAVEGSRPLLVEAQGLCVASGFGNPRRTTLGFDSTRAALLAAVLERRVGLSLAGQDLFINIAGGVSLTEPAADLPVALAIASSLHNRPADSGLVCFGEVGLSGEIRGVQRADARVAEAQKLGFTRVMMPATGAERVELPEGVALLPVKTLEEAIEVGLDQA
jgi:DNA repair protein RadA/Sms